jgi:hypothetical protein
MTSGVTLLCVMEPHTSLDLRVSASQGYHVFVVHQEALSVYLLCLHYRRRERSRRTIDVDSRSLCLCAGKGDTTGKVGAFQRASPCAEGNSKTFASESKMNTYPKCARRWCWGSGDSACCALGSPWSIFFIAHASRLPVGKEKPTELENTGVFTEMFPLTFIRRSHDQSGQEKIRGPRGTTSRQAMTRPTLLHRCGWGTKASAVLHLLYTNKKWSHKESGLLLTRSVAAGSVSRLGCSFLIFTNR